MRIVALTVVVIITLLRGPSAEQWVGELRVLPRYDRSGVVNDDLEAVVAVAALPKEEAMRLLVSESAAERGAALWSLYAQEEFQALFEAHELLDDTAPTLPHQGMAATNTRAAYVDQTIGAYLRAIYGDVLGHTLGVGSAADFRAVYNGVDDVDTLIEPWVARLKRARNDLDRSAGLRTSVRNLPETTRWLIVARATWLNPRGYTPEEAAAEFALLSADTKRKIIDGTIEPPLDPLYRKRVDGRTVNEWRDGAPPKWLLRTARSALGVAPAEPGPGAPPEGVPPE